MCDVLPSKAVVRAIDCMCEVLPSVKAADPPEILSYLFRDLFCISNDMPACTSSKLHMLDRTVCSWSSAAKDTRSTLTIAFSPFVWENGVVF